MLAELYLLSDHNPCMTGKRMNSRVALPQIPHMYCDSIRHAVSTPRFSSSCCNQVAFCWRASLDFWHTTVPFHSIGSAAAVSLQINGIP